MAGAIIYFDGPDGAGKTTQLELTADSLRQAGHKVHVTRSMGGSPIGELLRGAALSQHDRPVETDLYIAMACQYALADDILPRRERGEVVLVDRSPLSIVAYQVAAGGLDHNKGFAAVSELLARIEPELIIVYQAGAQELEARRLQRNPRDALDYFESKPADYHKKVSRGFDETEKFGALLVKADGSIDEVHQETMDLVLAKLKP